MFKFEKIKDYIYIIGLIFAIASPFLKDKLGISNIESNQSSLSYKIGQTKEQLEIEIKSLRQVNCNHVILLRGILRLQNESSNSNELIFSKMKVDAIEVSMARSRINEIKKEVLTDLKSFSENNNCIF